MKKYKKFFRPSAASRWSKCTGSLELSSRLPDSYLDSLDNEAASHGRKMHDLAKDILIRRTPRLDVPDDIKEYVEYIESKREIESSVLIEHRIESGIISGTPDAIIVTTESYSNVTLEIVDLKTGRIEVNAQNNIQLMIYMILAIEEFNLSPDRFLITIVQPHYGISSYEVRREDLRSLQNKIKEITCDIENNVITYSSGDWCTYCPATASCPLKSKEFEEYKEFKLTHTDSDAMFERINHLKEVKRYLESTKTFLINGLKNKTIHSDKYTLKPSYGHTKWTDEDKLNKWAFDNNIDAYKRVLRSPSEIKKEAKGLNLPKDLTYRKEIEPKIVELKDLTDLFK